MNFTIRPASDADRPWLREFIRERWGSEKMVTGDPFTDRLEGGVAHVTES